MRDPCSFHAMLRGVLAGGRSGARGSGRTFDMMAAVKDGDVIICVAGEERYLPSQVRAFGLKNVQVIINNPRMTALDQIEALRGSHGRPIFTHEWLEDYWVGVIEEGHRRLAEGVNFVSRGQHALVENYPRNFPHLKQKETTHD